MFACLQSVILHQIIQMQFLIERRLIYSSIARTVSTELLIVLLELLTALSEYIDLILFQQAGTQLGKQQTIFSTS